MRRVVKRVLLLLLGFVLSFAALLGVEIVLAVRHEYLPTEPALRIRGTFGDTDAPPLTFAVIGDSTAAGVGAGTPERAYPTLLARRIAQQRFRVRLVATGVSGARVADALDEQAETVLAEDPDVIFVGIGANDVTHLTSLDDIGDDMRSLLEKLTSSGAQVVVAGPPDMRSAVFYEPLRSFVGWRGRAVAARIAEVAEEAGVPVVPLAEGTRDFFAEDPDRYYSDDDFHPGAPGYALWADVIYPYLEEVLPGR